jgi:hypothetical protein
MRFAAALAFALALAAPGRAAEGLPDLRLSLAGPSAAMERPPPGLVAGLALDPALAGSGSGGERPEPVLALVLGVIPGFGLGHFYAGAKGQATNWLIIDLALLAGSIVIWAVADNPVDALVWVAWIVERGFEGYFAFRAAGGPAAASMAAPAAGALASLDPRSALAPGLPF